MNFNLMKLRLSSRVAFVKRFGISVRVSAAFPLGIYTPRIKFNFPPLTPCTIFFLLTKDNSTTL